MLTERFEQFKRYCTSNRKNVLSFAISLLLTLIFILGTHYFGKNFVSSVWILNGILLSLLSLMIMLVAGFAVLKALFFVAAELSLIIFLAQSYCGIPNRLIAGDEALKSLLSIGILYITVNFFRSLYDIIKNNYKKVEGEKWSAGKIATVFLYMSFTALFVWQLLLVIIPIINNLCVLR